MRMYLAAGKVIQKIETVTYQNDFKEGNIKKGDIGLQKYTYLRNILYLRGIETVYDCLNDLYYPYIDLKAQLVTKDERILTSKVFVTDEYPLKDVWHWFMQDLPLNKRNFLKFQKMVLSEALEKRRIKELKNPFIRMFGLEKGIPKSLSEDLRPYFDHYQITTKEKTLRKR